MKLAIIISTSGGVISRLLKTDYFRTKVQYIVSDRDCGAIKLAQPYNIKYDVIPSKSGKEFSEELIKNINYENCKNNTDSYPSIAAFWMQ
jgi:phosphoribosylglycinamide formyltransferase-1